MTLNNNHTNKVIATTTVVTLLWWLAAWVCPHPLLSDPPWVVQLLSVMGIVFLFTGLYWALGKRNSWTFLLFLYCVAVAMHWAGPPAIGGNFIRQLLVCIYMIFASAALGCLFLQLACTYPNRKVSRWQLLLIYLPVLVAIIGSVAVLSGIVEENALFLLLGLGSSYGIIGGMVWLGRIWTRHITELSPLASALLILSFLLGWLPNAVATSGYVQIGDYAGLTNLTSLALLVSLSWFARRTRVYR